jgi:hypothetical protein
LYQINSKNGVSRLELDGSNTQIVAPGHTTVVSEPRYSRSATVYVGMQGTAEKPYGRPVLDAAFDVNSVYVVPVVVVPNGKEPYTAAARLTLGQSLTVVKLYDGNLLPFDYDHPEYQLQYRNTLREIELDAAGNVYVTNANLMNESDILWKFEPNGTVVCRLDLDLCNPPVHAPTGLCVSSATNRLYLASSLRNDADPNSTVIYGFSTATLAPARTIKVSKMQHVTSITEDPITHSLWIAGFCFNSMPNPDPGASPFYDPYLAKVRRGENNVSAKCILDANYPKYLAMPLSIVWTGAQPIPKPCGGADLNKDGKVSMKDLAILANYWLKTDCGPSNNYCKGADLEPESFPDGDVDLEDLAILVEHWLDTGCP